MALKKFKNVPSLENYTEAKKILQSQKNSLKIKKKINLYYSALF